MSEEIFREAFKKLASDVASTLAIENALSGKGPVKIPRSRGRGLKDSADFCPQPRTAIQITRGVLKECNAERKRSRSDSKEDTSDEALSKMARFTDKFNLKPFEPFLHYVPRLVNVVTYYCSYRTPSLASGTNSRTPRISNPHTAETMSESEEELSWFHPRCATGWQRPFQSREAESHFPWTSTASPRAARTASTPPRSSPPFSSPTRSQDAACCSFVSLQLFSQVGASLSHTPVSRLADTGRMVGTGARYKSVVVHRRS